MLGRAYDHPRSEGTGHTDEEQNGYKNKMLGRAMIIQRPEGTGYTEVVNGLQNKRSKIT